MNVLRRLLRPVTTAVLLLWCAGAAVAGQAPPVSAEVSPVTSGAQAGDHSEPPAGMQEAPHVAAPLEHEPGTEATAERQPLDPEPSSYMKLTGRIWRATSGFVFARTPVGTLTLFSEEGLRAVKPGQDVTLWTHGSNVVVDIHDRGDGEPVHRFITAVPAHDPSDPTRMTLWTPDGGVTIDTMQNQGLPPSLEPDDSITVRLDQAGQLVDMPRFHVDIQISDGTKKRQGTQLKLAGTVSRVKAGFAFVETPIGVLTLSRNTGLRDAEAGQEITVWLNEQHLVIDVHQKGEPAPVRRFITSAVVYASEDKSEIKLWTPEGEKVLPLPPGHAKRRPFREGTSVTIQLNGSGEVIAVRKAG